MDEINLTQLVNGYRDRVRRLILMDPLLELERKKETDEQGQAVDMFGLGLLTLLFFFERRLSREYKTGVKELQQFLHKVTKNTYILGEEKLEKIARTLVQTFRPATGVKRNYPFFNWENQTEEQIEYSILKNNDFDLKTNTQYYTLDEDGLELIFSTKEFYSEYQISISQLLLRQQIMKGEFHGALAQIREMDIAVESIKERMEKIKLEILRSIVSEETFERYKKLLEDTHQRLERENEEFQALQMFIIETRDALYTGNTRKREERPYRLLLQITKELEAVHYEHNMLLGLTGDLKTTALATAQESLYYTGLTSFNFDKDIVSEIIAKPLPLDAAKVMLHPFLKVEENPQWSPMTIFADQRITEEKEWTDDTFIEAENSEKEDLYKNWLAEKYEQLLKFFLEYHEDTPSTTLAKWMEYIKETEPTLLGKRYFYSFWMLLHQRSPITPDIMEEGEEQTILGSAFRLLEGKQLILKELPDIVHSHKRYSIQNMQIEIKEGDDDLF